jgi:hypothetical protein
MLAENDRRGYVFGYLSGYYGLVRAGSGAAIFSGTGQPPTTTSAGTGSIKTTEIRVSWERVTSALYSLVQPSLRRLLR